MAEYGEPLSERELAVLVQLGEGNTNREIARDLFISPNTVKVHLRNIYTKLGVSSRTEATTVAYQRGLLLLPDAEIDVEEADGDEALESEVERENSQPAEPIQMADRQPARPPWRLLAAGTLALLALLIGAMAGAWIIGRSTGEESQTVESTTTSFQPEQIGDSRWYTNRPLTRPRSNMALVAVGLNLYQIGGEIEAGVVNLVDIYDTVDMTWDDGAPKPTAVADAAAAVLFGEIYVVGGRLADGRPTSVVEAYSPVNDAWRPVASLPQPISGGLALSANDRLYLFGGWDGQSYLADTYLYDAGADDWQHLVPMEHPRAFAAGGYVDDEYLVVGGLDDRAELTNCEAFSPVDTVWRSCPSTMLPHAAAAASVPESNLLYILGGGIETEVPYAEVYDAREDSWSPVEIPILKGVGSWHHLGVTNIELHIYALGGRMDGDIIADSYLFKPPINRIFLPVVGREG